jgi:excisionase family DNA binding protein
VEDRIALTVTEAAQKLGIGRAHLYRYVMSGELPSIKLGRLRRIPLVALDEFVRRHLIAGGEAAG